MRLARKVYAPDGYAIPLTRHGESVWWRKTEPHKGLYGASLNDLFIKIAYKSIAYMV